MAKKQKNTKKFSFKWPQEILEYYNYKNRKNSQIDTAEIKRQEQNKKINRKLKIWMMIAFLFSILVSIFISVIYNFTWMIWFFSFALIFILFAAVADLLITKNERRYESTLKLFFSFISIILLMGQLIVLINQNALIAEQKNLQEKQTQILQLTSQTNYPDVRILSHHGLRAYKIDNLRSWDKEDIYVGITNVGKTTAPVALIYIEPTIFAGAKARFRDGDLHFLNLLELKSGGYNLTEFRFWLSPPNQTILFGEKNITFRIDCPACIEPQSYQNITICIYNLSKTEECGQKWGEAW